jgi:dihydrolipoamide dehydrogenase
MPEQSHYDLIVVGAGPGGYVACARAAQLGMKVACIEKEPRLGGVCLNVGCIPSKALLDSSEHFHMTRDRLAEHGIGTGQVTFDLSVMMARKDKVVLGLAENVRQLLQSREVAIVRGTARLLGEGKVEVATERGGPQTVHRYELSAGAILLATGSEPVAVPGLSFDGKRIVSSTEALAFDTVPGRLGIVGGGYIGLELGSLWRRLGSEVTVIEMLPKIASLLDDQVGRALERALTRQGLSFRLKSRVVKAEANGEGVHLSIESEGRHAELDVDRLLVAVGRRPLTRGLDLGKLGVALDARTGHILVDEKYRTSLPALYAIGDLIPGPMLAHKASAEAVAAVEGMAGLEAEVNYDAIPAVIYTSPEVATVGLTEEQARERGISYRVGTFPFAGSARARSLGQTEGFVKCLSHSASGRILGVHIFGPQASELIAQCVPALESGATTQQIARTVHAHPTLSEALHEAVLQLQYR